MKEGITTKKMNRRILVQCFSPCLRDSVVQGRSTAASGKFGYTDCPGCHRNLNLPGTVWAGDYDGVTGKSSALEGILAGRVRNIDRDIVWNGSRRVDGRIASRSSTKESAAANGTTTGLELDVMIVTRTDRSTLRLQ